MTDLAELQALLARAVELDEGLEGKAAPAAVLESDLEDDDFLEDPEVDVDDLRARIAELEDLVEAMSDADGDLDAAAAELDPPPVVEEPTGRDFVDDSLPDPEPAPPADPPTGEEKAAGWAPCPECGSRDADEFADGTARCVDCGAMLSKVAGGEKKAYDFSEVDAELAPVAPPVETKAADDPVELDDMEVLRARRLALEV